MTWRVRFAGVLAVALFVIFAFSYVRFYINPKPHGVIVFIAPGLSPELMQEARCRQAGQKLDALEGGESATFVTSKLSGKDPVDPRSLLSILASGQEVPQGEIGINLQGKKTDTLLYQAQRESRTVGVVSSTDLSSPGISAFYTHLKKPEHLEDLGIGAFDSTTINVILTAGGQLFNVIEQAKSRDLVKEATKEGYQIAYDKNMLEAVPTWLSSRRLMGVFGQDRLLYTPSSNGEEKKTEEVTLALLVRRAIQTLQFNISGYFLVVDHHALAVAIINHDREQAVREVLELDRAMKDARDYAGKNTLIFLYSPYQVSEAKWGENPDLITFSLSSEKLRKELDFKHYVKPGLGWLTINGEDSPVLPAFMDVTDIYKIIAEKL